jgi:hypothetical protein
MSHTLICNCTQLHTGVIRFQHPPLSLRNSAVSPLIPRDSPCYCLYTLPVWCHMPLQKSLVRYQTISNNVLVVSGWRMIVHTLRFTILLLEVVQDIRSPIPLQYEECPVLITVECQNSKTEVNEIKNPLKIMFMKIWDITTHTLS